MASSVVNLLAATKTLSNVGSWAATPGAASSTSSSERARQPGLAQNCGTQKPFQQGSVASVEAEFGMDPHSIALKEIERLEVVEKAPATTANNGEDEANDQKKHTDNAERFTFSNDAERDEYTRKIRLVLAQKRSAMEKTINILRAGAKHLSGSDETVWTDSSGSLEEASSSTSAATRQRWVALQEAQRYGWGLTPGRPGRNEGWSGQQHRTDEGEQDAWIGFGVPEARPMYARRALAFMQRDNFLKDDIEHLNVTSTSSGAESSKQARKKHSKASKWQTCFKLVFASRANKRLMIGIATKEADGLTKTVCAPLRETLSANIRQSLQHNRKIDHELRAAQEELVDVELFDDLAAEARLLASQGLVDCRSTDDSVRMQLAPLGPELVLALRASPDNDKSIQVEENEREDNSGLLSLIDCFTRFSLIKRYRQRAAAKAAECKKSTSTAAPGSVGSSSSTEDKSSTNTGAAVATEGSASSKAGVTSAKKQKLDLWEGAPCLMPILGILHYMSFVVQVKQVVERVLSDLDRRSSDASERMTNLAKFAFELRPAQSISNASIWLAELVEPAVHANSQAMGRAAAAAPEPVKVPRSTAAAAIESLSGTATMTASTIPRGAVHTDTSESETVVLAHLSMSYPSKLTVQLPWRRTLSGALGVTMHQVEVTASSRQTSQGGEETTTDGDAIDLRSMIVAEVLEFLGRSNAAAGLPKSA